jgi:hypothetical protein
MFRIKKVNTVTTTNEVNGGSDENIGLSPVDSFIIETDAGSGVDGSEISLSSLTVEEVASKDGPTNVAVRNVTTIKFDNSTGFNVTDQGQGDVLIDLGSSFADIFVEGQTTLEAQGEDKIEFIAGDGIKLTTTIEHTGSTPKAITFSTVNKGIYVIDASDNSEELPLFLDMVENSQNYRGAIVYLTDVGPTQRPDPFLWKDKFYFNEGSEWFESPLAIGRVLDDL